MFSRSILNSHAQVSTFGSAAAIGVIFWLLQVVGCLDLPDSIAYDSAMALRASIHRPTDGDFQLSIVYLSDDIRVDSAKMSRLVARLDQLGARQLACAFPPIDFDGHWSGPHAVFGVSCASDPANPSSMLTSALTEGSTRVGLLLLPPTEDGTYRSQLRHVEVGNSTIASFESVVVRHVEPGSATTDMAFPSYLIDFLGGPGSLPHMTSEQVLSGNVLEELIRGKTVLIGFRAQPAYYGFQTPTTKRSELMSPLEFHGHAINTLLTGRPILEVRTTLLAAILVMVAVSAASLSVATSLRSLITLNLGLLVFLSLGVASSLIAFRIWTPLTPLVGTVLVTTTLVNRRVLLGLTARMRLVSLEVTGRVRRRRWPTNILSSEQPWNEITALTSQLVPGCRMVFFEADPKSVYLREVRAVGCKLDDIFERRRDVTRAPYSDAVAAAKAYRCENRQFFVNSSPSDDDTYLVPLIFSGELYGFWALDISQPLLESIRNPESALSQIGLQIAEMLYLRHTMPRPHRRRWSWQRSDDQVLDELSVATRCLERRLSQLEGVFRTSDFGSAIFDPFGRLLLINDRMSQQLQQLGLSVAQCSNLSCLQVLSGHSEEDCHRWLREALLFHQTVTLPVANAADALSLELRLKPIIDQHSTFSLKANIDSEVTPFHVAALQVDLVQPAGLQLIDMLESAVSEEILAVPTEN